MAHSYPQAYFGESPSSVALDREEALAGIAPYKRHLVAFIDGLPEGARLLDIGCGSGRAARLALALRPDLHIEACDINDVRALIPDQIAFRQCAAEAVGDTYNSESFDAVMCQHVIEHLQSPLGLMDSIRSVLKQDGVAFLETPNWTRLFIPFSHMFFWNDYTHVRPYPKFALLKLLLEHDMSIEYVRTCSSSTWFSRRRKIQKSAAKKEGKPLVDAYRWNSRIVRLVARALNPLLRDIIIVVARKVN